MMISLDLSSLPFGWRESQGTSLAGEGSGFFFIDRFDVKIAFMVIGNQLPKGIIRSAVPLPCFFDVVMSREEAGQRPQQGTKSCRMGRNSVYPTVHLSVRLSTRSSTHPLWLALRPCWLTLRPCWLAPRP